MYRAFFGHKESELGDSKNRPTWFFIDIEKFLNDDKINMEEGRNSAFIFRSERPDDIDWFSMLNKGSGDGFFPYQEDHEHLFPLRLLGAGRGDRWLLKHEEFWLNKQQQHKNRASNYQAEKEECSREIAKLQNGSPTQYHLPVEDDSYEALRQQEKEVLEIVSGLEADLQEAKSARQDLQRESLKEDHRKSADMKRKNDLAKRFARQKSRLAEISRDLDHYKEEARKISAAKKKRGRELDSQAAKRDKRKRDDLAETNNIDVLKTKEARAEQGRKDHLARASEAEFNAGLAEKFASRLNDVNSRFVIPQVLIETDMAEVAISDMFSQLNRHGKRLEDYDLLNAYVSLRLIPFKEMMREFIDELRKQGLYWRRAQADVMRVMLIDVHPDADSSRDGDKYNILVPGRLFKGEVRVKDNQAFERTWAHARIAYINGLNTLRSESLYGKQLIETKTPDEFVPFPGIVPVYCSLLAFAAGDATLENCVRQWYWASVLTQRYSAAQDSSNNAARGRVDFREVHEWFDDKERKPEVIRSLERQFKSGFFTGRPAQGVIAAIRGLFFVLGPRNWDTGEPYATQDVLLDQILTAQECEDRNIPVSTTRSVFNDILVAENTASALRTRTLKQCLDDLFAEQGTAEAYKILESHCISRAACDLLKDDSLTDTDYDKFLREREAEFLRQLAREIFNGLDLNLP